MQKDQNKLILFFVVFFLFSSFFHLQAFSLCWHNQSGRLLLSYAFYQTKHFWNREGKRLPTYNRFIQQSYEIYFDYDLTTQDTIFLEGAYDHIQEEVNGRTWGFEDWQVGWSHTLYRFNCQAIALQIVGIIPSGPHKSSLRYGVYGTEINLLYSRLFHLGPRIGFFDAGGGYRAYHGFPSDQLWIHTDVGCFIYPYFYLMTDLWLDYGLGNGKKHINDNFIVLHSNYQLLKGMIQGTFYFHSNASFSIGYEQHIWGRNTGTGETIFSELALYF